MSILPTGNRIGADWQGPYWTPFALAIADHYRLKIPWFYNELVTLGIPPTRQTVLTSPQEHDILIFGAHAQGSAGRLPFVYLQISHQESGVPWAVPNVVPFIPLTAFAGINDNNMPNLKLPDAFFLPRNTQLKLAWTLLGTPTFVDTTPVRLTLIGVQLINPRGGSAPKKVTMPDGQQVRPDSRLPFFMTIGLGGRSGNIFLLNNGQQRTQFLPPIDCDVEIHDLSANVISAAFGALSPASNLSVKLTTMGVERQWTPNLSPITAVFGGPGGSVGGPTQVFPALPYPVPYLLKKDRRIQVATQNNSDTATYTQALVTFRGVRLCEY